MTRGHPWRRPIFVRLEGIRLRSRFEIYGIDGARGRIDERTHLAGHGRRSCTRPLLIEPLDTPDQQEAPGPLPLLSPEFQPNGKTNFAEPTLLMDAALNRGGAGSGTVEIDTQNPTVTVDIVDGALNDGDASSVVTFAFSEAPGASFTESDIQVSAGLSLVGGSLSQVDATHYTATVTAADGFSGTGTVSVAAGSYTDAALSRASQGPIPFRSTPSIRPSRSTSSTAR